MVSEDDTSDFLDFTKNLNDMRMWFALIPNYDAKSYVLSLNTMGSSDNNYRLILDPKNPAYNGRRFPDDPDFKPFPIVPVVFNEIISVSENDVVLD